MLKPNESKRDWLLFHMTPAGMSASQRAGDGAKRIALIVVGGMLAVGLLLAAYAGV